MHFVLFVVEHPHKLVYINDKQFFQHLLFFPFSDVKTKKKKKGSEQIRKLFCILKTRLTQMLTSETLSISL